MSGSKQSKLRRLQRICATHAPIVARNAHDMPARELDAARHIGRGQLVDNHRITRVQKHRQDEVERLVVVGEHLDIGGIGLDALAGHEFHQVAPQILIPLNRSEEVCLLAIGPQYLLDYPRRLFRRVGLARGNPPANEMMPSSKLFANCKTKPLSVSA